jgi:hypothetical protein
MLDARLSGCVPKAPPASGDSGYYGGYLPLSSIAAMLVTVMFRLSGHEID